MARSAVVRWGQLVPDLVLAKEVFERLGALVVEVVEVGLKPCAGQKDIDTGDGVFEVVGLTRFDGAQEDVVAVMVVGHQEIVVTGTGGLGEAASLVRVHNVVGGYGGKVTLVHSVRWIRVGWETVIQFGLDVRWWHGWFGRLCVLPAGVQVPHGGCLEGRGVLAEGSEAEARQVGEVSLLDGGGEGRDGGRPQGRVVEGDNVGGPPMIRWVGGRIGHGDGAVHLDTVSDCPKPVGVAREWYWVPRGACDMSTGLGELDGATSITQRPSTQERLVHVGEQVGSGSVLGQTREKHVRGVGRVHGLTIGYLDSDGAGSWVDVGEGVGGSKVMSSAPGVQDDGRGGT
jgi:hypothetical protein